MALGRELAAAGAAQAGSAFTDIPEADALIKSVPEAFLLGILFTQGIPAERAWAGPYHLKTRLGHLDIHRLASEPEAIVEAIGQPPALHRFIRTLPGWISSAARRLLTEYGGSAGSIWAAGTSLPQVVERLRAFDGIGPKKAVMAAEILVRHFGVELGDVASGSVAYDVHVRRVFMRSGLIMHDSPEAVCAAARAACPEAPGTLDLATWLIGREYCRPTSPRCDGCSLGAACPRLVDLTVEGVGTRR